MNHRQSPKYAFDSLHYVSSMRTKNRQHLSPLDKRASALFYYFYIIGHNSVSQLDCSNI